MKNLLALRTEKGVSQEALAKQIGSTQQNMHRYEHEQNQPDIQTMILIADFFETSIDYLVGHTDIRHKIEPVDRFDLNEDEASLVEKYRRLNSNARGTVMNMLDTLLDGGK